jgi:hypothetical protein
VFWAAAVIGWAAAALLLVGYTDRPLTDRHDADKENGRASHGQLPL